MKRSIHFFKCSQTFILYVYIEVRCHEVHEFLIIKAVKKQYNSSKIFLWGSILNLCRSVITIHISYNICISMQINWYLFVTYEVIATSPEGMYVSIAWFHHGRNFVSRLLSWYHRRNGKEYLLLSSPSLMVIFSTASIVVCSFHFQLQCLFSRWHDRKSAPYFCRERRRHDQ